MRTVSLLSSDLFTSWCILTASLDKTLTLDVIGLIGRESNLAVMEAGSLSNFYYGFCLIHNEEM
jgi:hypothetical protein